MYCFNKFENIEIEVDNNALEEYNSNSAVVRKTDNVDYNNAKPNLHLGH